MHIYPYIHIQTYKYTYLDTYVHIMLIYPTDIALFIFFMASLKLLL